MIRLCLLADAQSIHTRRWCAYFVAAGYDVHLISFREAAVPDITMHFVDCGPIRVEGSNKRFLLKIPRIRKIIRNIRPDIVHALYATSYGLTAALSGFHPQVVTALGSDVLISPFQSRLYRMMLRYIFRKADHLTAMSDPMREVMIGLGAAADKLSTVIFGIDPAVFHAEGRQDPANFTIVSTRNFEPVYNIDQLILALAKVKAEIPGLRVQLVGAGTREHILKEMVHTHGLGDTVIFHGRIPQTEIADLLRHAQLFISVSSSDGNNISLNEAMACGCFSVVSDIPANRQWVEEGINGFYCGAIRADDIAAAIRKAVAQYPELNSKARSYNAKLIAEKALWSVNMKKVEYLYEKLMRHES